MSESLPHHQHISGVSTQNRAQAFVGSARDVYFAGSQPPQEASEQAARVCHNALFLTDPYVDRESVISAKGKKVAGTCEWITRNDRYRDWLNIDGDGAVDDNVRLLWISGGPGKGKTMMSIFLTEELQKHAAGMDNADLAFFFCSAEDEKRNTAIAVLRGLVHQIVAKRPQLIRHALKHFETPERTQQTLSSLETLWIIFSRLVADAELGTMFCVLDGLDECEESTVRVLLHKLVDLLASESSSRGTFKLAIVSRDLPVLQGCRRIRLDPDNNEKVADDIELVVSARMRELSRIEGFDGKFQASVQTALLARAQGTFLWVGFAMHELSQKQTRSEIWEALNDLPSGLLAIYGHMLQRIPAKHRDMSGAILRWVTLAVRPLTLQELAGAVGKIQSSSPQISLEQATRDAIALCGPLVKVQEQEVSLVHQSARDYLVRAEPDSDAVLEAFRIKPEPSHFKLAQTCLRCIAESSLQYRAIALDDKSNTQEPPLLRYAALHWPEHAKSCSTHANELFKLSKLSRFFFEEENLLRIYWWEIYKKERGAYYCKPPPLLHMACTLEILLWVQAVLGKKSWRPRLHRRVDKKDERGETVLHLAADRGIEAVVWLLVEKGADVKARDNHGHTVLHSAARGVNEAVVRLLLERGADVKAKDEQGETALHLAAWRGNEAVVRLLVERGADVNARDNDGYTVLYLAALRGNKAIVRVLVEKGADVKAKDKHGATALHLATLGRNEAVVRLLLERGADVKAKDEQGETALHLAAWRGNEAVVRLLVERGADVNARDNDGYTVLYLAALGGNKAIVRVLDSASAGGEERTRGMSMDRRRCTRQLREGIRR